jgi:hypothetical protein
MMLHVCLKQLCLFMYLQVKADQEEEEGCRSRVRADQKEEEESCRGGYGDAQPEAPP